MSELVKKFEEFESKFSTSQSELRDKYKELGVKSEEAIQTSGEVKGMVDKIATDMEAITSRIDELKEVKLGKKGDSRKIIEQEGEQLLARVPQGAYTVALDEKGKLFSSEELAELLNRHMLNSTPELTFVIGGPYGLSKSVKEKADLKMSLSPMTLTHQMARLLLLEQIYRGMTILRNEPYHNR